MDRMYYEAYDDRYRQVHEEKLQWFSEEPTAIVWDVISRFSVRPSGLILEIGCGEGRDARFLLERGYNVLATDISPEAVSYCQKKTPVHSGSFQVLDCISGQLDGKFDMIYAVAVVHMLVRDEDRNGFYSFLREHLAEDGIGLVCTMGSGELERASDIRTAFDLQERHHQQTGKNLMLAGTSCRVVSFSTFFRELAENGLAVAEHGLTAVEPDFPQLMYAVVKRM